MEPAVVPSLAVLAAVKYVESHESDPAPARASREALSLIVSLRRWCARGGAIVENALPLPLPPPERSENEVYRARLQYVPNRGFASIDRIVATRPRRFRRVRRREWLNDVVGCLFVARGPSATWTRHAQTLRGSLGIVKRWRGGVSTYVCKTCRSPVRGPTSGGEVRHDCERRDSAGYGVIRFKWLVFPALE